MIDFFSALSGLILAYLLGAIPFGLIIARAHGVDLRHCGSGNIGATNVFRCVGPRWGVLAFVLDMFKGMGGVWCAWIPTLWLEPVSLERFLLLRILCGAAAMLGHIFPIYLRFKGGKGVSTALGLLLGVAPLAGVIGFGCWGVAFLISRYVSVASCLVVGAIVWTPLYGDSEHPIWFRILIGLLAVLAIWKHRQNMLRLYQGTENRFAFTAAQRTVHTVKQNELEGGR